MTGSTTPRTLADLSSAEREALERIAREAMRLRNIGARAVVRIRPTEADAYRLAAAGLDDAIRVLGSLRDGERWFPGAEPSLPPFVAEPDGMSASTHQELLAKGYTHRADGTVEEIVNAVGNVVARIPAVQVWAWLAGERHGAGERTCVHVATEAGHAHAVPVASCPWCIVERLSRELKELREKEDPRG